jgi:hypothetical protein
MKKLSIIAVLLCSFSTLSQAQKIMGHEQLILEKINDALSHYTYTLCALSNKPPRKVQKISREAAYLDETYFHLFVDARECLVEDIFVNSLVAHRDPVSPEDIYTRKLSTGENSRFKKISLNFKKAKFRCEMPVIFNLQMLKNDPIVKHYLSYAMSENLSKKHNLMYVKTLIIPQKFKGIDQIDESNNINTKDIIAIHWIFPNKKPDDLHFYDFKIISWNTDKDCESCRILSGIEKNYYRDDDEESFTPNEIELMRDSAMLLAQSWKIADSVTNGNIYPVSPKIFASNATLIDPFSKNILPKLISQTIERDYKAVNNREFGLFKLADKAVEIKKNTYAIWIHTTMFGDVQSDSNTLCTYKKPVPIRIQVQFEKYKKKLCRFKINKIDFEERYNHKANFLCESWPKFVDENTENMPSGKNSKIREEINQHIMLKLEHLMEIFMDMASKKTIDKNDLYNMFENGERNTVEVIGCESQKHEIFLISEYQNHMNKLPYHSIRFQPDFTSLKLLGDLKEANSPNELRGIIEFSHAFFGYKKKKIKYADTTVKSMEVMVTPEGSGFRVQFGNIKVISNDKLSLNLNIPARP